jgi:hypothetical protein
LINLADYSPPIIRFIKSNQFACLYVFAVDGHRPCKVGHALNLRHRHGLTQEAHAEPITIECVIWTPSAATAALIAEDIRHRLGVNAGSAGWWNVEPAVAIDVVRKACALFPSRWIVAGWWNVEPAVAIDVVRKACALFPSRWIVEHEAFIRQAAAAGFTVPAARFA